MGGQPGRILGCPYNPDSMEGCVCKDIQGGSLNVLGILRTAWRVMCEGTSREDPRDVLGILQTAWTPAGNTGQPLHFNRVW